jgi:uncharacterized protein
MAKMEDEAAVITTYTGRHIDLVCPQPEQIHIDDIAWPLCSAARFVGHTARMYTVGEHLLLGVDYCTPEARLAYFSHDFAEAYLGDVSGPLKRMFGMQFYRDLEAVWDGAICDRFGLPRKRPKEVELIDRRMLVTEMRDLSGRRPQSTDKVKPFPMHLSPVERSREHLAEQFLAMFYDLVGKTPGAKR